MDRWVPAAKAFVLLPGTRTPKGVFCVKLIHCADFHLDSPMESNLPPEKAKDRRAELRSVFSGVVLFAVREGVSAILIAGDLFDRDRVTKSTRQYVLDTIAAHPDIRFFCLSGNHDRQGFGEAVEELPKNLFTFGKEWTTYALEEGISVIGSEAPDAETFRADPSRFNILLLHGQVREGTGSPKEGMIRLGKLKGLPVDYVAMGHIHEYREYRLSNRTVACYSGCPEGRGFDECGPRGIVLLEVRDGKETHRLIPFAKRTMHCVSCDITGIPSQAALEEGAFSAVKEIPPQDAVKLVLRGACPPELMKDLSHLQRSLQERFYFAVVRDESRLLIDPAQYEADISLKGEFVRTVLSSSLDEEEKERVLSCGLRALRGEEVGI